MTISVFIVLSPSKNTPTSSKDEVSVRGTTFVKQTDLFLSWPITGLTRARLLDSPHRLKSDLPRFRPTVLSAWERISDGSDAYSSFSKSFYAVYHFFRDCQAFIALLSRFPCVRSADRSSSVPSADTL